MGLHKTKHWKYILSVCFVLFCFRVSTWGAGECAYLSDRGISSGRDYNHRKWICSKSNNYTLQCPETSTFKSMVENVSKRSWENCNMLPAVVASFFIFKNHHQSQFIMCANIKQKRSLRNILCAWESMNASKLNKCSGMSLYSYIET